MKNKGKTINISEQVHKELTEIAQKMSKTVGCNITRNAVIKMLLENYFKEGK